MMYSNIHHSGEYYDPYSNLPYRKRKKAIEKLSSEKKTTQSKIIRERIDDYLSKKRSIQSSKSILDYAGIWKDKEEMPDVRALRKGWGNRHNKLGLDDH